MEDKRKYNGGPRKGTGPKPKEPGEEKKPITFYVKEKNKEVIKEKITPIIKKLDK